MKHKTWFRLVVKALGLYFFTYGMLSVLGTICMLLADWIFATSSYWHQFDTEILLNSVLQILAGAYLFFSAEWIVNLAIPSNRPYCPNCGYDLSKRVGDHCPECGVAMIQEPKSVAEAKEGDA